MNQGSLYWLHKTKFICGLNMAYQATIKTEENKLNRRKKIVEVAKLRIKASGFSGVSMVNIAKEVGVATGTLYRYFPSKQDLCTEVFRIYTEIEVQHIDELAHRSGLNAAEKLQSALEAFAFRAIKSRQLAWSLIAEPLDPMLEAARLHYRQSYADIYEQLIEEGVRQQLFLPQIASVSAAAIVGALAESLVGPLSLLVEEQGKTVKSSTNEIQNDQIIPNDQIIQNIVAFCLSALGYQANKTQQSI